MKKGDKVRVIGLGSCGLASYLADHAEIDAEKAVLGTVVGDEIAGLIAVDLPSCPLGVHEEGNTVWLMEPDELELVASADERSDN